MVAEETFKVAGHLRRPFSEAVGVRCRGYSLLLQRRITDFGSERAFARAASQIKEHYGLEIAASTVRRITEGHGQRLDGHTQLLQGQPNCERAAAQLVAETDGTMIPTVTIDSTHQGDRRKTRQVRWNEARLGLVYEPGSAQPIYAATTGNADAAGDQLEQCAAVVGMDRVTQVHAVGDGAPWIAEQVDRIFGLQASYLIDFYHLSDYLAAAAKCCAADHRAWLSEQQHKMKVGAKADVIAELERHQEPASVDDGDAPVRACLRYMRNRPTQFDYPKAIAAQLPIGSGKIESGHRHVIQARLKVTGAWWDIKNAASMLNLRAMRANNNWDAYWQTQARQDSHPSV